jgi:hypothetical protein
MELISCVDQVDSVLSRTEATPAVGISTKEDHVNKTPASGFFLVVVSVSNCADVFVADLDIL